MPREDDTRIRAASVIPGHEQWLSSASFWLPTRFVPASAWNEHGPFAMWAVTAFGPRTLVELGTHYGFSYFTMCDAIRRMGLPTKAWAIDSWEGDEHAGFYDHRVYDAVREINADYEDFSNLLRGYFDSQVDNFEDGSIDLLHIDGRHRYEDVKEDFETYLPKMSSHGVVMFHDIAERHDDFGVWKFWEELAGEHPSFAFRHGHGLGVLGVGSELPDAAERFFAAAENHADEIRATYEHLGGRLNQLADHDLSFDGLHAGIHEREVALQDLTSQRDQLAAQVAALTTRSDELEEARAAAETTVKQLSDELLRTRATLSWRITRPLRAMRRRRL
ncbi:class I SAM-dependent methyltransferase [Gryllotalpicola koreensis]|uniref:Class I SAM-dependent methyltransferase n=1 Tax=Gryllotalpicola koreensis TaxID=993086 RepID=A0ABP8A1S3_9MICO